MEQNVNNRLFAIGAENHGITDIKARSGLLISREPNREPVKITKLKNVRPALNRTIRCDGPMIIEDEETRKFFTDGDGVVHSVVFTDPVTGERRFG